MFVVVSSNCYIGWKIGELMGKGFLWIIKLVAYVSILLLKAAWFILVFLIKYAAIALSMAYTWTCKAYQKYKISKIEKRYLAP